MDLTPPRAAGIALAGFVTSWDPVIGELWVGQTRLSVPPEVPIPPLTPQTRVIVGGYQVKPADPRRHGGQAFAVPYVLTVG